MNKKKWFDFLREPDMEQLVANHDAEGLIKALRNKKVRVRAIEALIQMGEVGVDHLVRALAYSDVRIRAAAAGAFEHVQEKRAVEPLLALFSDHAVEVRYAAVWGLLNNGSGAQTQTLKALGVFTEIILATETDIDGLIASISGAASVERIIARDRFFNAVPEFLVAYPDPVVRAKTALVLYRISGDQMDALALRVLFIDPLISALQDSAREVRLAVAMVLAGWLKPDKPPDEKIVTALSDALAKESDLAVRNAMTILMAIFSGK